MLSRAMLLPLLLLQTSSGFVIPSAPTKGAGSLSATVVTETCHTDKLADIDPLLESMSRSEAAASWSEMFGLGEDEKNFYALFEGVRRTIPIGLRGKPFVLKKEQIVDAVGKSFGGYFDFKDLEQAVNDDFLDAGRGSTDNRKGWKMTTVSSPRGQSFEEARMTFEEIQSALEKGTVIFNAVGGHIPKLAGATLACTDATSLPSALNMYVTAPGKRTSAPPHTDKQDVVVVQTSGAKHWKVYSPPNPAAKPSADMFTRGKGDDNLPLFALETDLGCELILETTLQEGDVMFIPAAFPHTTDTAEEGLDQVSIHLTFGLDTHIWDLDYLNLRRLCLRRSQVVDTGLGQTDLADNPYVGTVNTLPTETLHDVMEALPYEMFDEEVDADVVDRVVAKLENIARSIDEESTDKVDSAIWKDATVKTQEYGKELLEIHRDMYLSAVEEGRTREMEAKMTAHLEEKRKTLTPEQIERLSLFRVKRHFDKIDLAKKDILQWSFAGKPSNSNNPSALPEDWQFTSPVSVGDEVEADLGGAFFPAKVTKVAGSSYDVQFFDGDMESGLERSMLKLLKPPPLEQEVDTSGMTPKELKRWKKEQEKKKKHG